MAQSRVVENHISGSTNNSNGNTNSTVAYQENHGNSSDDATNTDIRRVTRDTRSNGSDERNTSNENHTTSATYVFSTSSNSEVTSSVSESTTTTTTNTNSNSQSDVTVAVNKAASDVYASDQELAGVLATEQALTTGTVEKLAFAQAKIDAILPLIEGAIGTALSDGAGGGGSIGFHSAPSSGGMTMSGGSSIGDDVSTMGGGGMGFYSRRTLSSSSARALSMGAGDAKTAGIGFAASGTTIPDDVAATQLPIISTSGVLTPSQVQQSVNSVVARTDTRSISEIRRVTADLTGRGFSPSSPILGALRVGIAAQGLRASLDGIRETELSAAKLNADGVFQGQKAVSDQFLAQEGVLNDVERIKVQRTTGILSAIAQMIGAAS